MPASADWHSILKNPSGFIAVIAHVTRLWRGRKPPSCVKGWSLSKSCDLVGLKRPVRSSDATSCLNEYMSLDGGGTPQLRKGAQDCYVSGGRHFRSNSCWSFIGQQHALLRPNMGNLWTNHRCSFLNKVTWFNCWNQVCLRTHLNCLSWR